MAKAKSQIGVFWGETSLSIVRVDNGKISTSTTLPFPVPQKGDPDAEAPEYLRRSAFLKEKLVPIASDVTEVGLALPTQKLIFRSFHIPFMSSDEIRSVIEFEVTKYVPIPIHELVYTYHAEPFTDRTQKMLRIIFIAIRKTALDEYVQIFRNAGFEISHIEPAGVASARILRNQKFLNRSETTAMLSISADESEIMVFDNDVMQFIRTLNLGTIDPNPQVFRGVLADNIGVSVNFFSRQNPQSKITKFLILADFNVHDISPELSKDINIPTRMINVQELNLNLTPPNIDTLIAYGATLKGKTFSTRDFDLSPKAVGIIRSGVLPSAQNTRIFIMAGTLAGCLIAPLLTNFITAGLMKYNQGVLSKINSQLGKYEVLSSADIEQQSKALFAKVSQYSNVQMKSEVAFILYKLSSLMPKGIWLTNLSIQYVDAEPSSPGPNMPAATAPAEKRARISITGKIYLPEAHEQVRVINDFIASVDENPDLANLFDRVKRNSITETKTEEYTITEFSISCEDQQK